MPKNLHTTPQQLVPTNQLRIKESSQVNDLVAQNSKGWRNYLAYDDPNSTILALNTNTKSMLSNQ
jgi:hypothetical protein